MDPHTILRFRAICATLVPATVISSVTTSPFRHRVNCACSSFMPLDSDRGQKELKDERAEYTNANRSHPARLLAFSQSLRSAGSATGILPRSVPPSLFGGFSFFKAELLVELVVGLTVDLDIRVDEVIERWAILPGRQLYVPAGG